MMTARQFEEQEVQIARCLLLGREVTDPLAACLLRVVTEELQAELQKEPDIGQRPLFGAAQRVV